MIAKQVRPAEGRQKRALRFRSRRRKKPFQSQIIKRSGQDRIYVRTLLWLWLCGSQFIKGTKKSVFFTIEIGIYHHCQQKRLLNLSLLELLLVNWKLCCVVAVAVHCEGQLL